MIAFLSSSLHLYCLPLALALRHLKDDADVYQLDLLLSPGRPNVVFMHGHAGRNIWYALHIILAH